MLFLFPLFPSLLSGLGTVAVPRGLILDPEVRTRRSAPVRQGDGLTRPVSKAPWNSLGSLSLVLGVFPPAPHAKGLGKKVGFPQGVHSWDPQNP